MIPVGSHPILKRMPGLDAVHAYWHTEYYAQDEKTAVPARKVADLIEYANACRDFAVKQQTDLALLYAEKVHTTLEIALAGLRLDVERAGLLLYKLRHIEMLEALTREAPHPLPPIEILEQLGLVSK